MLCFSHYLFFISRQKIIYIIALKYSYTETGYNLIPCFCVYIIFIEVKLLLLRIRDLREDNDLLQKHLAEYLNCRQQTYSRYEIGEVEPPLETMEKLSIFYKTSVDYLMGLTDNPVPYERKRAK